MLLIWSIADKKMRIDGASWLGEFVSRNPRGSIDEVTVRRRNRRADL